MSKLENTIDYMERERVVSESERERERESIPDYNQMQETNKERVQELARLSVGGDLLGMGPATENWPY